MITDNFLTDYHHMASQSQLENQAESSSQKLAPVRSSVEVSFLPMHGKKLNTIRSTTMRFRIPQ